MKRGTTMHPKVYALARLLGISRSHAVGIMECLWHWTANYAPDGSLSRWSDSQIADAVDWPDAEQLRKALTHEDVRFLDADGFVHDWPHHCDDAVQMKLARAGRTFACGCTPNARRLSKAEREAHDNAFVCARHTHGVRTESALPLPLPTPLPEPTPEPAASAPPRRERAKPEADVTALSLLVSQFTAQCEWTGKDETVYERFRKLMGHRHDAATISAVIQRASPGMTPWAIADEVTGATVNFVKKNGEKFSDPDRNKWKQ